jgi:hypothetical protein
MTLNARLIAVLAVSTLVGALHAQESAHTLLSEAEMDGGIPAGAWQGNWRVVREDPRIHTRGGAELARLHVIHDAGAPTAVVQWVTGPAVCEDPLAGPCEWVGARGEAEAAAVADTGLYVLMPVSADASAPLLLHLSAPVDGARGVATDGHLHYSLVVEREAD